jgi:paraquat-inducible protein A
MPDQPAVLADRYPVQVRWLRLLLALAFVCLVVGLVSPVITLEKFLIVENTFSVLSGVLQLLREGHVFLFLVITGFSVLLPFLKLGVLLRLLGRNGRHGGRQARYLHWMHHYGKWSMLDVFVVAILVVAVKLGAIARVEMRYGLYAFAAAILLTMFITARIVALTSDPDPQA